MNELGNTPADKNYKPSGISKAQERAFEAYPKLSVASVCLDGTTPVDLNTGARKRFIEGYEQAEQDLALTWEDMKTIEQIIATSDWYDFEINDKLWSKEFYEEVLKRFKETKNED